jgi:hypothetical protein
MMGIQKKLAKPNIHSCGPNRYTSAGWPIKVMEDRNLQNEHTVRYYSFILLPTILKKLYTSEQKYSCNIRSVSSETLYCAFVKMRAIFRCFRKIAKSDY